MDMQVYYMQRVRGSKNELRKPRTTFNWGYHSAKDDMKMGRPLQDVSNHFDPYYAAGYTLAQEKYTSESSSEIPWILFVEKLSIQDYNSTARSVLESIILGREYLFSKKTPRNTFPDYTVDEIVQRFDRDMPASNAAQMKEKMQVLRDFSLI